MCVCVCVCVCIFSFLFFFLSVQAKEGQRAGQPLRSEKAYGHSVCVCVTCQRGCVCVRCWHVCNKREGQ